MSEPDDLDPINVSNGVICHHCFRTIDLAEATAKRISDFDKSRAWNQDLKDVNVLCPYCNKLDDYSFSEIQPLTKWTSDAGLATRLRTAEAERDKAIAERDKAVADAKILARELHNASSEETDLPSSIPKDTAQKPPIPPEGPNTKKKDEHPDYLR